VALVVFVLWSDRRQGKDEIGSMLELAEHPPDETDAAEGTEPAEPAEPAGPAEPDAED